ncbi:hypothetical protein NFJ02_11g05880 [Pycnococcus provasolii]
MMAGAYVITNTQTVRHEAHSATRNVRRRRRTQITTVASATPENRPFFLSKVSGQPRARRQVRPVVGLTDDTSKTRSLASLDVAYRGAIDATTLVASLASGENADSLEDATSKMSSALDKLSDAISLARTDGHNADVAVRRAEEGLTEARALLTDVRALTAARSDE